MIQIRNYSLGLLILMSSLVQAQMVNTSHKKALEIKEKVLLVVNKGALGHLVKKYWTFHEKIEYVEGSQVKSLMKKNKGKYVLLENRFIEKKKAVRNYNYVGGTRTHTTHTITVNSFHALVLSLKRGRKHWDVKINLSDHYSQEHNIMAGLLQMQQVMNYLVADKAHRNVNMFYKKQAKINSLELKNKTLLIDKNLLAKKLKLAKIKEYYPFPYKIVSADFIEKSLKEQNPDYAFIHIANTDTGKGILNVQFVASTYNGKIYSYLRPRGLNFLFLRVVWIRNRNDFVGKTQLRKYAKGGKH